VLKLHYLKWLLFPIKGETYFMYQGIFDTDFDKYTEDAVALFGTTWLTTVFENLEGFSYGLEDERCRLRHVRSRASLSELFGNRGVSLRESPTKSRKRSGSKANFSNMLDQMQ
jgi:hypothetical protein